MRHITVQQDPSEGYTGRGKGSPPGIQPEVNVSRRPSDPHLNLEARRPLHACVPSSPPLGRRRDPRPSRPPHVLQRAAWPLLLAGGCQQVCHTRAVGARGRSPAGGDLVKAVDERKRTGWTLPRARHLKFRTRQPDFSWLGIAYGRSLVAMRWRDALLCKRYSGLPGRSGQAAFFS